MSTRKIAPKGQASTRASRKQPVGKPKRRSAGNRPDHPQPRGTARDGKLPRLQPREQTFFPGQHDGTSRGPSSKENPRSRKTERNVSPPPGRENPSTGVYTSVWGDSADVIERVAALYFKPGDEIADLTYGKGAFWRKIDTAQYEFYPSDVITCPQALYDVRELPYRDDSFDVDVLDLPFSHNPGRCSFESNYRNVETTEGLNHDGIMQLYEAGMTEAMRILKPNGLLLLKCQDEIESGKQRWSHIEVYEIAKRLGMVVQDLFVMTQKHDPMIQRPDQKHARKNHSFFWLFKKCKR
jgi:hypothetical protein